MIFGVKLIIIPEQPMYLYYRILIMQTTTEHEVGILFIPTDFYAIC